MFRYVLMDLDGTLTDPGIGITNSIIYALERFGIHPKNRESLYRFIGPPLMEELSIVYGFSKEESQKALEYYREYFAVKGLYENRVYDGIPKTLQRIKDSGRILLVATSKPEVYSLKILEHFDLLRYFDYVAGSTMDSSRVRKSDVIAYAVQSFDVDPKEAIMVGDRENDILGAAENNMSSLGVLYGYGSKEELQNAGATLFAKTPEEILSYI